MGNTTSAQQIVNALLRWKGSVKAAAEDLGMRRNSLYERIERMGLDLAAFRGAASGVAQFERRPGMSGMPGVPGSMSGRSTASGQAAAAGHVQKSTRVPYRRISQTPTLPSVDEAVAPIDLPIRTLPSRSRPLRVLPENQERLREARRRLSAAFGGAETDETLLLNQMIEERLEAWVREKEALARPQGRKAKADK